MANTSSPDSNYTIVDLPADGETMDAADVIPIFKDWWIDLTLILTVWVILFLQFIQLVHSILVRFPLVRPWF